MDLIGDGVVVLCGFGWWVDVDIEWVFVIGIDMSMWLVDCGVLLKDIYGVVLWFVLLLVIIV